MKKRFLLTMIGVAVTVISITAQRTINLQTGAFFNGKDSNVPTRDVVVSANSTTVTYTFDSAILQEDELFDGCYWWRIDGFGFEDEPTKPAVLSRLDQFVIPRGANVTVEVIESSYKDYHYPLTPARQPLTDSGNDIYTKQNVKPIDKSIGLYPKSIIEKQDIQSYRGENILSVKVSPIQYDVTSQNIRAYTKIKYKVTYSKSWNTYSVDENINSNFSHDDYYLKNIVLNSTNVQNKKSNVAVNSVENVQDYLIISVPKYAAAANEFAQWKKMLGFNTHVVLKSSWSTNEVKDVIREYYEKNNLYYMLIIGDHEDVPAESSTKIHTHVTDFFYGCMDGSNDVTPDVYRGRLPVSNANEAQIVVNKIIQYERNPITTSSFYKNGLNCAYFQDLDRNRYADRRFAQTSEDVRNYLQGHQGKNIQRIYFAESSVTPLYWNNGTYSKGEAIPADLKKPTFAWDGDAADITSAINKGVFYVLHRDHGAYWGWGDPEYDVSDINTLSNGAKLPVVFSLNCLTGKFNDANLCFAEAFLRKANGGSVGIYGATESSYSGYNDVLAGGMFDAIWPSPGLRIVMPSQTSSGVTPTPTYRLGQILDQGFARLSEIYGANAYYTIYTKELFHCFGDPSMQIYTDTPTPFTNVAVNRETDNITVSLANGSATITFYDLTNGNVISYIGTSAIYNTNNPQNVTICISGHNKIPYIQNGIATPTTYIQNETIVGPKTYNNTNIKIGSNVTTTKNPGPVVFQSGSISLTADKIEINPNTTISNQTEFKVTIK